MTNPVHREAGLESRLSEIMGADFIERRICSFLPSLSNHHRDVQGIKARIVQNIGTGRATVEYQLGNGVTVFAKLYSDDSGAHSYAVLKKLWEEGFGGKEKYRIPEALCYLPDDKLLLLLGAGGVRLSSYIDSVERNLVWAAREAARWLVKLHSSPVRIGREGDFSADLLGLSNKLIKAVGQHPKELSKLSKLTTELRQLARAVPEKKRVVQVHGRLNPDHVLLGGESVSVIDWDKSCPNDPAVDLAEFLRLLRLGVFSKAGNVAKADQPTKAFLEEYASKLPECAGNLTFYWGSKILISLSRSIKNHDGDNPESAAKVDFYQREFEDVISGRFTTDC